MKNISLTTEELVIVDRLKQMKMSGMAEAYEEQIKNPNSDLSGFYERFSSIVNYEWELRFNKKFNRFLKKQHSGIHRQHLMTPSMIPTGCWTQKPLNGLLPAGGLRKGETFLSRALPVQGNLTYQMHCVLQQSGSLKPSNISEPTL